ncbi:MAG: signal peptidase I [Flavobacteriales bacterium]|nr:signal peptidase I [Flavobacteriales bacterium]MCC6938114.1 signal peptidase I [Flavobacteriales bacterium]
MIPYIFLYAYFAILLASLWKLFQKAGKPTWAAFVPGYNILVWLKITGKPWWWIVLFIVPGVNLLMFILMNVNISIVLGERRFKEHVLMTFLPWWKVPATVFAQNSYVGPIPAGSRKRGLLGQWGDAILFAVIVATVFRTYTFEAFTIPTPSMEKSLLVGDYLFVSKLSYGPRLPMTPLTFPFTHHTIPVVNSQSFVTWFSQPYRRLPGFGTPQRGDAVVFNFPEGDTVVANFQNQSYYQLKREHGFAKLNDPNYRMAERQPDGREILKPGGGLLIRPVDKQENYIKRCIGTPGDSLRVTHGQVYVNSEPLALANTGQYNYEFVLSAPLNTDRIKTLFDISASDVYQGQMQDGSFYALIPTSPTVAAKLEKFDSVVSMKRQDHEAGFYSDPRYFRPIFPSNPAYDWSEDNFGPLWIPKAGATLQLDLKILPLYERAIRVYEGHDLKVDPSASSGQQILIDGSPVTSYTFEQDYYWMMGDNRHRSQDSRFWGFVPFDHIVGKAVLVWFTKDPDTGIRWKRLFTVVR